MGAHNMPQVATAIPKATSIRASGLSISIFRFLVLLAFIIPASIRCSTDAAASDWASYGHFCDDGLRVARSDPKANISKYLTGCMEFIRRLPPAFLRGVQIGYEQRAWMRYFQGDLSGALSEFDALIKRDRKTGLYSRADFFKEIREYGRAIADYDELTRLLPDNGTVYYNRGEAWAQKAYQAYNDPQLFDRAFSDLAKAMNMEPKWTQAWAYLTRGNIETHLEQHDKAL